MSVIPSITQANEAYAASFPSTGKGSLPLPPAKKLLIVTCMDARVEPFQQLGIQLGDSHVVRNAGGSAQEALRSIVISQRLLGTREIAVFRHTDCGMTTFKSEDLRAILKDAHPDSKEVGAWAERAEFLEFSDPWAYVKKDVEFLRSSPLVLEETVISGWVYEVETGKIHQVL